MPTDFRNVPTLGLSMMAAFSTVAPRYGVRLEGIEDDANEHSVFWQEVANEILKDEPQTTGVTRNVD